MELVDFKNEDNYETFLVTTKDADFKGLYSKVDKDIIRKSPDKLAFYSIDEFEVTQEMVNNSTIISKGINTKAEQDINKVINVTPIALVKYISVVARVENLVSAKKSSGALKGAVGSIQMSTRKPIEETVTHVFIMNNRKYDNPAVPKDGTIEALVPIFDHINAKNLKVDFLLDFLLYDDTTPATEVFDITNYLKTDNINITITLGRQKGGSLTDRAIILPAIPLTGGAVGVDDWSETIIRLK